MIAQDSTPHPGTKQNRLVKPFDWVFLDGFGDTFYALPHIPKTQTDEAKQAISQGMRAYHESKPYRTRKRNKQFQKRQEKAAKLLPKGPDDEYASHPRVADWLQKLRSVSPNIYTKRLGPIKPPPGELYDRRQELLECLPNRRTHTILCRFYSDWTDIRTDDRALIFNGCLSVDVKSCYFSLLMFFARRYLDREWIDKRTGEIIHKPNKLDRFLNGMTLDAYFERYRIEKWLWKTLVNACLRGLSREKIRRTLEEYRVDVYPEIFDVIQSIVYAIQTNRTIVTGLDTEVYFRYRSKHNKDRYSFLLQSFEFRIKEELFRKIPKTLGTVVLDLHDGVIFNLRADSYRQSFEKHIQNGVQRIFDTLGLSINVEIDRVHYPLTAEEVYKKQKSREVRAFIEHLDQTIQEENIADSDPFLVDDLVKKGLASLCMEEKYNPDWHPDRLGFFE